VWSAATSFLTDQRRGRNRAEPLASGAEGLTASGKRQSGVERSDKNQGDACASPVSFGLKSCYFFLPPFFLPPFFLVAMLLFSLSIIHGCAV
jgi:uncharacterized membrane protein